MIKENLPILAAFQKKPRNLPHDTAISPHRTFYKIYNDMLIHTIKYTHQQNEIPPQQIIL